MRRYRKIGLGLLIGIITMDCSMQDGNTAAAKNVDSLLTPETEMLYRRLVENSKTGVMLGHQDDLAYGHGWYGEKGRSDVKDVLGVYPPVIGWELGDLELGKVYNLDSVYFDDMRHHVQQTAERGGVSTFSWHGNNIATGGNAWDCQQDTVVRSILPGGEHHQRYLDWLDKVADFFLSLQDEDGKYIPIVFRPYHEHTGSWFWWGERQCTPEEYKALWMMTIDYFRQQKELRHVLYCYSAAETRDEVHFAERYPGDDYVDLVAFDTYVPNQGTVQDVQTYRETMERNLNTVTGFAAKRGKLATIGETGYEGIKDAQFFTRVVYPLLADKELAWVLFWRNAYESGKEGHYYVPFKGHPAAHDFVQFSQLERIRTDGVNKRKKNKRLF